MTAMSRQQAIRTAIALPVYALACLVWAVLYACHLIVSAVAIEDAEVLDA